MNAMRHTVRLVVLLVASSGLWAAQVAVPLQGPVMTLPDGTPVQGTSTLLGGVIGGIVSAPPAPQQGAPAAPPNRQLRTGTSRIAGRIVTNTGQPLRQAMVRASAAELNGTKTTTTDQDGRYEFTGLPAGRYSVSVSKVNYIPLNYGQTRPGDIARIIALGDNQRLDRIDMTVPRGGVIAGRVVDEFGDPATDVQVIPMQKRMSQGQLRLMATGRTVQTNDIGEFRIFGLPPGQYFVSSILRNVVPADPDTLTATPRAMAPGYAPTYYPATTTPSTAQPVTVGLSETVSGIDIQLQTTALASISGSTMDSQGAPLTRGSVSAILRDGSTTNSSGGPIRPDGTFVLTGVAPGEYLVRANVPPPPPPPPVPGTPNVAVPRAPVPIETLMAIVTVNGSDVSGVVLTPMKKVTITGRITFDGPGSASLRSSMIQLSLSPRSPEASMGLQPPTRAVREDFSVELVAPAAEVVIRATVGSPLWAVKAIRVSGVDITDTGVDLRAARDVDSLEVELTSRPPEVSGTITDARGEAQVLPVLVFPQERERWIFDSRLIATGRPDQTGRYRIRTLPPGRYLAAAIDGSILTSALQDPDVLEGLRSRATPFTLAEGEIKTVDLKVAPGR